MQTMDFPIEGFKSHRCSPRNDKGKSIFITQETQKVATNYFMSSYAARRGFAELWHFIGEKSHAGDLFLLFDCC